RDLQRHRRARVRHQGGSDSGRGGSPPESDPPPARAIVLTETARCGLLVWLSRSCHNSRIKGAGYIEHVARSSRKPGRHEASLGRRVDMTARRNTASIAAAIAIVALAGTAKAEGWDKAKAEAECAKFTTYGMAEDGVYGPWFKAMYAHYGWKSCNRT